jgi:hypothetical protein
MWLSCDRGVTSVTFLAAVLRIGGGNSRAVSGTNLQKLRRKKSV